MGLQPLKHLASPLGLTHTCLTPGMASSCFCCMLKFHLSRLGSQCHPSATLFPRCLLQGPCGTSPGRKAGPQEPASGVSWPQVAWNVLLCPQCPPSWPLLLCGICFPHPQAFNIWSPAGLILLPGNSARPVTTLKGLSFNREPQALLPSDCTRICL